MRAYRMGAGGRVLDTRQLPWGISVRLPATAVRTAAVRAGGRRPPASSRPSNRLAATGCAPRRGCR